MLFFLSSPVPHVVYNSTGSCDILVIGIAWLGESRPFPRLSFHHSTLFPVTEGILMYHATGAGSLTIQRITVSQP